jgi:phosphosulfolactate synthase
MNRILPFIPERPGKPRNSGLTMVMDKGLSVREAEDFMSVGSEYTDYVKLGFGTSLITPRLSEKIKLYKAAGVIPYFGGTLFEAFIIRNMFPEFLAFIDTNEIELVEVSDEWVTMMKAELDAGSDKVIAEARESGTTGIYNEDGSINNKIISAISEHVKLENVIWEAPLKSQQAWFIKHFGANVNLGNISPAEIIPLESLRLGLRGDTFFQFLPEDLK